MKKIELKPCPFCGGEAELVDYGVSGAYEVVQCSDCWVRTRLFDKSIKIKSAVDAWNRRVGENHADN